MNKLAKLLTPILTIGAVATPLVALTSCNSNQNTFKLELDTTGSKPIYCNGASQSVTAGNSYTLQINLVKDYPVKVIKAQNSSTEIVKLQCKAGQGSKDKEVSPVTVTDGIITLVNTVGVDGPGTFTIVVEPETDCESIKFVAGDSI